MALIESLKKQICSLYCRLQKDLKYGYLVLNLGIPHLYAFKLISPRLYFYLTLCPALHGFCVYVFSLLFLERMMYSPRHLLLERLVRRRGSSAKQAIRISLLESCTLPSARDSDRKCPTGIPAHRDHRFHSQSLIAKKRKSRKCCFVWRVFTARFFSAQFGHGLQIRRQSRSKAEEM